MTPRRGLMVSAHCHTESQRWYGTDSMAHPVSAYFNGCATFPDRGRRPRPWYSSLDTSSMVVRGRRRSPMASPRIRSRKHRANSMNWSPARGLCDLSEHLLMLESGQERPAGYPLRVSESPVLKMTPATPFSDRGAEVEPNYRSSSPPPLRLQVSVSRKTMPPSRPGIFIRPG